MQDSTSLKKNSFGDFSVMKYAQHTYRLTVLHKEKLQRLNNIKYKDKKIIP